MFMYDLHHVWYVEEITHMAGLIIIGFVAGVFGGLVGPGGGGRGIWI
jgi:hypothetical protein